MTDHAAVPGPHNTVRCLCTWRSDLHDPRPDHQQHRDHLDDIAYWQIVERMKENAS